MQKDAGTALVAESVIAELCQKLKNLILQLAAWQNFMVLAPFVPFAVEVMLKDTPTEV